MYDIVEKLQTSFSKNIQELIYILNKMYSKKSTRPYKFS